MDALSLSDGVVAEHSTHNGDGNRTIGDDLHGDLHSAAEPGSAVLLLFSLVPVALIYTTRRRYLKN
jgi:hypothetical protein